MAVGERAEHDRLGRTILGESAVSPLSAWALASISPRRIVDRHSGGTSPRSRSIMNGPRRACGCGKVDGDLRRLVVLCGLSSALFGSWIGSGGLERSAGTPRFGTGCWSAGDTLD